MKNVLFVPFFLIGIVFHSNAQKHDDIWLFGRGSNSSRVDFNVFPPKVTIDPKPINLDVTNASVCDKEGNLLFYTNGAFLYNGNHQLIQNSLDFNPGEYTDAFDSNGLVIDQGAIILPDVSDTGIYHVFHETKELGGRLHPTRTSVGEFRHTTVDINENNGKGKVISKKNVLVKDTLSVGGIVACKHANGRDWWLPTNEFETPKYYMILLSPEGAMAVDTQFVGTKTQVGVGQSAFSPDGNFYARHYTEYLDQPSQLDLYDFDRCTGKLSNHRQIFLRDSIRSAGVVFSPDSRFLYAVAFNEIYQFDLHASNWKVSIDTVAIFDGFSNPFPNFFLFGQLAPDGKIYISSINGTKFLHVIHNPNKKGIACNVEQHSFDLKRQNTFSLPNFPNYRLGSLEGSPCDTLGFTRIDETALKENFSIFPNPTTSNLTIQFSGKEKINSISLFDLSGATLQKNKIEPTKNYEMNLDNFSSGIYLLEMKMTDGSRVIERVILQR